MAFPTVLTRVESQTTSNGTSHTVSVGSPSNGDLVILLMCFDGTPTVTMPTGWTSGVLLNALYTGSAQPRTYLMYKVADGTEGASITVTTSASEQGRFRAWVIDAGTYTGVPEITSGVTNNTTSINPPSHAASWGSVDTLWFALGAVDSNRTVSTYPTSYTQTGVTAGGATSTTLVYGERETAVSPENPAAFTVDSSSVGYQITMAVQGVSASFMPAAPRTIFRPAVMRAAYW